MEGIGANEGRGAPRNSRTMRTKGRRRFKIGQRREEGGRGLEGDVQDRKKKDKKQEEKQEKRKLRDRTKKI